LVEGGPLTWRAFADAGLIDEAVLFHARRVLAAPLPDDIAAATLDRYLGSVNLARFEHRTVGSDDMMVFRRPWSGSSHGARTVRNA
jgi:riboflavin biosynthesis pyrimidine reductase